MSTISRLRWLALLVFCLIGFGIWRGWFGLATATRDPATNQVDVRISVDANKVEADAKVAKEKIADRVSERVQQLNEKYR